MDLWGNALSSPIAEKNFIGGEKAVPALQIDGKHIVNSLAKDFGEQS